MENKMSTQGESAWSGKKTKMGIIIFLALFCVGIFPASAQEKTQTAEKQESCADYYTGGVAVSGTIPAAGFEGVKFSGGNTVSLNLYARNESKVEVPDIYILVKIEKEGASSKIVDEFLLPGRIALKLDEEKKIEYGWEIPADIEGGNYSVSAIPVRGNNLNIGLANFYFLEKMASANLIGTCFRMG
jgi:hypothetical protein